MYVFLLVYLFVAVYVDQLFFIYAYMPTHHALKKVKENERLFVLHISGKEIRHHIFA